MIIDYFKIGIEALPEDTEKIISSTYQRPTHCQARNDDNKNI